MKPIKYILSFLTATFLTNCSDGKFSGAAQSKEEKDFSYEVNPENPDDSTNSGTSTADDSGNRLTENIPPPGCTANYQTTAKAVTSSIKNTSPGQIMRYQIGLKGCDSNLLKKAKITTDLKAVLEPVSELPYKIKGPEGKLLGSGRFQVVYGQDLFGNQGDNFFYWQSTSIDMPFDQRGITLEMDFSDTLIIPLEEKGRNPFPLTDKVVESYFSLVGAKAVKLPLNVLAP